jgi:4-hydroxy-L-threonine phosphate dehydrogenase PdxA
MGDPGGIGPEIVVRALAERRKRWPGAKFVVLGSSAALHAAADRVGVEPGWVRVARSSADDPTLAEIAGHHGVVLIDSDPALHARGIEPVFERRPNRLGGELSHRWVEDAIALAQRPEGTPCASMVW